MADLPRTENLWGLHADPCAAVATAGAYVMVDGRFAFGVGPTPDGKGLAVYRLGGHREAGETPWQCVERELMEEAGLRISPLTPPCTYWLQLRNEAASKYDALVAGPWPSGSDVPAPIFVARGIGVNVNRLSAMFLATAEGSLEPLNECHGLLFLTPAEMFDILNRPMTLRQYLRSGGHATLRWKLPEHLPLVAHLQLRVLPALLKLHPNLAT